MPAAPTVAFNANTPHNFASTQDNRADLNKTSVQVWDTGEQGVAVNSIPPKKKGIFSPLVLGLIAVFALLAISGAGVGGAYMAGLLPWGKTGPSPSPGVTPEASPGNTAPPDAKPEMVQIPAGMFQMGSNEGDPKAQPQHPVNVQSFWMDKTEVTDDEYLDFVTEMSHVAPRHWSAGRPLPGTENDACALR